ncbi:MAG TPA: sulfatase-like hydrolase/transferase [Steroidobacteraceae bacterium]|nr:sulfatase-like hydrolase/transferase [Steroidobacteraceae bacterium]
MQSADTEGTDCPSSPDRRALLLATIATLALPGRRATAFERTAPNIVFILADDLGYADVGCYGRPDIRTPHIDRLATQGTRLTQAYANSAVCTATRTALITGRYQYRLRIGLEEPLGPYPEIALPPETPTLPALLRRAGYATALVGKWHLGEAPQAGPLQRGYDHFYGFRGGALDYFSHKGRVSPGPGQDPAGGAQVRLDLWDDTTPVEQAGYLTEMLGRRAVAAIDGWAVARRPFFLSLHFNAPHWPWEGPGDQAESDRLSGKSMSDFDGGTQQTYRMMVETLDAQIGRVLAALEQHDLSRNTIVIFTSDNGGERYADTWPFTGRKTELLEGGLRIPALIRWPGRVPAGVINEQVMISMDWMPTLLHAAGAATDPDYPPDGIDLLPELTGAAPELPRTLYWRYKANAQRAVRDGDYKYLKIGPNTFLFDVVRDPMERANLKDRQRELYDRLVAQWHAWNRTMLPEIAESRTDNFTGAQLADHVNTPHTSDQPDPGDD